MKRICLFLLIACTWVASAAAQKTNVQRLIEETFKYNYKVETVKISGERLKPYKLTYFISAVVRSPQQYEIRKAMEALLTDVAYLGTDDREEEWHGDNLVLGMYTLQPWEGKNRYIFFRDTPKGVGRKRTLTLIYMEGSATMQDLKRNFYK